MTTRLWGLDGSFDSGSYNPKSTTVDWLDTDNPDYISENCPKNLSDKSIKYTLNSHGARSREFVRGNEDTSILTLGCSISVGIGVKLEDSWPGIIDREIDGAAVYNFSQGGASMDYIARAAYLFFTQFFVPDVVMLLSTFRTRSETVCNDKIQYIFPRMSRANGGLAEYPEIFLSSTHYLDYNKSKNLAFINTLCDLHGTRLIVEDCETKSYQKPMVTDRGRDGSHPGPGFHRLVADKFFDKFYGNH